MTLTNIYLVPDIHADTLCHLRGLGHVIQSLLFTNGVGTIMISI